MKEENKDSIISIADQVEKSVIEKSNNAERFVRNGLGSFENLIYKLLAVRPKDLSPKSVRQRQKGTKSK